MNELDRSRFMPVLACLASGGPLKDEVRSDVHVFELDVTSHIGLVGGFARLRQLITEVRPCIVHTHLVHASLIGRIAARSAGVPFVVSTQHNAYYPKQSTFVHRVERLSWRWTDVTVALSAAIAEHLRTYGYRGRVEVIPTGVDIERLESLSHGACPLPRPYVLSVGHFRDKQKGHDVLVEAFAVMVSRRPGLRLAIAGDGPQRPMVIELARRLGIADSVLFLGNRRDIPVLMRHCSVFALASRWEGFGRVLIEAMALGCPVIATSVEGIPDVVKHDQTGWLVAADDPRALARALETYLEDQAHARRVGASAREVAIASFSLRDMVSKVENLYDSLLS